jgi:phospholipase/carboxylesterase
MNRIRRWPDEAAESFESATDMESSLPRVSAKTLPDCELFAPYHYEPNYAYPLLLWLHGPGDDERQLRRIMPHISLRNYVAVGPRGCCEPEPGNPGYRWQQSQEAIDRAELQVFEAIELAVQRYNVCEDRIFLGGYQCGGTMALRIGMRYPGCFAGVLSVGGSVPRNLAPLSDLLGIRQLPIFIAQGRDSEAYPIEQTCDELRLFHTAAMHVTLRQYPCGDEMTTQILHDMDLWMMEQISGVVTEPETSQTTLFTTGDN